MPQKVSKNMRAKYPLLGTILPILSGCYWSSWRTNTAAFAGTSVFQDAKPLPINIVHLGVDLPSADQRRIIEKLANKVNQVDLRNKALLYADLGLAALYKGDLPVARKMLDQAVCIMTSVTEAGPLERHVTSLVGGESEKLFKGEAHERALVLFFRGILYLADGDVENAHACFLQVALQDATAEDPNHRCDWLCADLLALYCKQRMETEDRVEWRSFIERKYNSKELPTGYKKIGSCQLLIVCCGLPPQKIAGEEKGYVLRYENRPSSVSLARLVFLNGEATEYKRCDDTYIQAVTRGSRAIECILREQAKVRGGIEAVGSIAAAAGAAANVVPGAALAGGLLKELSWSISDMINTSADTRQIHMLPGEIFVVPIKKEWESKHMKLELLSESRACIARQDFFCSPGQKGLYLATVRY